jgi:hypothetical protein
MLTAFYCNHKDTNETKKMVVGGRGQRLIINLAIK